MRARVHVAADGVDRVEHRTEVAGDFDAVDGMRVFIRALLGFGIKPDEVKIMLKDNPAKLMWLDE